MRSCPARVRSLSDRASAPVRPREPGSARTQVSGRMCTLTRQSWKARIPQRGRCSRSRLYSQLRRPVFCEPSSRPPAAGSIAACGRACCLTGDPPGVIPPTSGGLHCGSTIGSWPRMMCCGGHPAHQRRAPLRPRPRDHPRRPARLGHPAHQRRAPLRQQQHADTLKIPVAGHPAHQRRAPLRRI